MRIEGLNKRPEPKVEVLGEFKLKDRVGRSIIQIDFRKLEKSLEMAECLYIAKIAGESNKIRVSIQWKPVFEDNKDGEILLKGGNLQPEPQAPVKEGSKQV